MAMTNCRECEGRISDQASTCPHCGAPETAALPWGLHRVMPGRSSEGLFLRTMNTLVAIVLLGAAWMIWGPK